MCDSITDEIVFREGTFYSTVKSYETLPGRRIKKEPRFLAHLTPTASESLGLSFFGVIKSLWMLRRSPVSWIWYTRLEEW